MKVVYRLGGVPTRKEYGMQYELAPVEMLEVVDALLFRANALGRNKREQATDLRKLAMRLLGASTKRNGDVAALAREAAQLSIE
jgi:hypothetical protein